MPFAGRSGYRLMPQESATLLQRLQLLTGLEAHCFAWRYGDLRAGARIAANAGFARAHVEDPEAAQLDTLAAAQGALHAFENGLHRHLRLGFGDARFIDHFVDDIELDQSPS